MDKPIYLLITWVFPSETNWRGAFAYDFAKAVQRDGRYRVVVVKNGPDYEMDGIRVCGYHYRAAVGGIPNPLAWWLNRRSFASALKRAGIEPKDVAVVHAFSNARINEARVVKWANPTCRIVTHHHDPASFGISLGRFRHFWPFKLISFLRMRYLQEQADLHVFISEGVKRSFLTFPNTDWTVYEDYRRISRGLRCFRPVRIKRGIVLHNGVDTAIFNRVETVRQKYGPFVIGCIGNFISWKDQMTLLRAVELLKERPIKVIFVGSGPELERCRAFAVEKGLNVEFRSEVRHEALADFYRSLDLFCLPSYFEGFGCVFTEAWSCGTPFITCEGQGMDDLIAAEDRKLWLCKPRDAADLAEKIGAYIEHLPKQKLTGEVDIDKLVPKFLDSLI